MKQTAVEWLEEKIWKLDDQYYTLPQWLLEDIEQAKEMEKKLQGYSEEEVLPIIEYIQWVLRKIDAGNTPEEIVRLLLFEKDKIEQFKNK